LKIGIIFQFTILFCALFKIFMSSGIEAFTIIKIIRVVSISILGGMLVGLFLAYKQHH